MKRGRVNSLICCGICPAFLYIKDNLSTAILYVEVKHGWLEHPCFISCITVYLRYNFYIESIC